MMKTPTVSVSRFRCSRVVKDIFFLMSDLFSSIFFSISCVAQRTHCYYYHFAHFFLYYKRGHSLLFGLWCTVSHQHGWANRKMDRKAQLIFFLLEQPYWCGVRRRLRWEEKSTASTQHEVFQIQHTQHMGRKWNVEWLQLFKGDEGATPEENETFVLVDFRAAQIFFEGVVIVTTGGQRMLWLGWEGQESMLFSRWESKLYLVYEIQRCTMINEVVCMQVYASCERGLMLCYRL